MSRPVQFLLSSKNRLLLNFCPSKAPHSTKKPFLLSKNKVIERPIVPFFTCLENSNDTGVILGHVIFFGSHLPPIILSIGLGCPCWPSSLTGELKLYGLWDGSTRNLSLMMEDKCPSRRSW